MTDIPDYTVYDNDDEVTQTPANFEEVHELLERFKEKKEEPQNLPIMEPEFQRPFSSATATPATSIKTSLLDPREKGSLTVYRLQMLFMDYNF